MWFFSQANVVVNEHGTAALCDFGLSKLYRPAVPGEVVAGSLPRVVASGFTATHAGGTLRYLAPELFEENSLTPASDVYAFASTCAEVSLLIGYSLFVGLFSFVGLDIDGEHTIRWHTTKHWVRRSNEDL